MTLVRKIIGLFIIFCIGVPVLIGIIWSAGISQSVLSPEFYQEVPQKLVKETPRVMDELLIEMKDDLRISDPNTRQWLQALAQSGMTLTELIEQSGIGQWLEGEVVPKLAQVGEMLKGKKSIREVRLDLRPLKQSLRGPVVRDYILGILNQLPACNEDEARDWVSALSFPRDLFDLPACRPADPQQALLALELFNTTDIGDIPDSVPVVEHFDDDDLRFLPLRFNIFKFTMVFIYLLFLIPLAIIFTGALIHGEKSRWFGAGLSLSALSSYVLVKLSFGLPQWIGFFIHQEHYLTAREEIAINKALSLLAVAFEPLSRNIETISGIIFLVGLAFFVFSFYRRKRETAPAKESSDMAAPESPPRQTDITAPETEDKE